MWRSLLFVPALNNRLIASAARRGADAIVLDLEAAVPPERKADARAQLPQVISLLKGQGATVAVRINLPDHGGDDDLDTACRAGASIIVLPKATPTNTARAAASASADVKLIPLIEGPRGVIDALAIAEAAKSVAALGFGVEDYATEMGVPPTPELLTYAGFQVIQAARAAIRAPLVIMDTIADYKDLQRFEAAARNAHAMGASGSFAIHPMQVDILNREFTPGKAEREKALCIVEAAESARRTGEAIASIDGQMIDAPVEARARAILKLAEQRIC